MHTLTYTHAHTHIHAHTHAHTHTHTHTTHTHTLGTGPVLPPPHPQQALYKLKNYYKMIIVRNPLERLLSAYRNKIEPPLNFENRNAFPDEVKLFILRHFRHGSVWQWRQRNQSTPLSPTFGEFLRFMSTYPLSEYNEHFMPVLDLCSPCAVYYDFYANFKSLDYDVFAVLDYLNISCILSQSHQPHSHPYKHSKLPWQQKKSIFSQELQFYYSLYTRKRRACTEHYSRALAMTSYSSSALVHHTTVLHLMAASSLPQAQAFCK